MAREIMFRVFDTQVGEMVDTGMHVIGEALCCGRIEIWINNHENEKGMLERYNDMVLMQYTGLEDRKGNDIYEGDIVKDSVQEANWLIYWNKPDGAFRGHKLADQPLTMGMQNLVYAGNSKIIGNKFEDPQLLKEVKNG